MEKDKEKIFRIVDLLIGNPQSKLDTKYLKSHEKVAIFYKDHIIEIIGGENISLRYLGLSLPLKKKEHKRIFKRFMAEFKKGAEETNLRNIKKFEELL